MSVMSCNCEKPAPKHKLGVFCVVCKGFIEENNKARTEKLIDDQARLHPWFEKKTPSFEGKAVIIDASTPVFDSAKLDARMEYLTNRIMSDGDIQVLQEHLDLMEDVRTGDYKPDSFTNQSLQILIDRLLNK